MKKLSLITKICISIFLLLISVALLLSVPLYRRLDKIIDKYSDSLVNQISEKTGLVISYESISPSILAYLGIKGIKLSDTQGRVVAQIKNTHIKYKILPLLKKNYDSILKGVSINGVDLNIMELIDFIEELNTGNSPPGDEVRQRPPPDKEKIYELIKTVMDYIPPNITVKNLALKYNHSSLNASLLVKEIRVLNSEQKNSIDFNIKTSATIFYSNIVNATGDILFNGSLNQNLDDSFVNINFSNFAQGKFKLNKLNFLATYKDQKVNLRTVQNVIPIAVDLVYDFNSNEVSAKVQSDKLNPSSVFSSVSDKNLLNKIRETKITLIAEGKYKVKENLVSYFSDGQIFVPDSLVPGTITAGYSLRGDNKAIYLDKFDVNGQNYSGNASLSFIYKTFQLSGLAELEKFVLPNGNNISTEIYFDPLENAGFMLFSPQLFIGDKALTAIQADFMPREDSIDFDLEINDYSHIDDNFTQGTLRFDGSYLTDSKYVQTSVSLNTIYLDSVLEITKQVIPENKGTSLEQIIKSVAGFVFSGDAYFSTDFKSVSYNLPYLVLANTQKENQVLLFAMNGNEQSIQVNNFYLVYDTFAIDATASLDSMPDSPDKFYTIDILSSSIPYHFAGTIMPEVITLTGDYGTEAELRLGKDNAMDGYATFKGLPFMINNSAFIVSLDTLFNYDKNQGPQFTLQLLQIEKDSPDSSVNPRLEISGSGTKYGAQINSISYTDLYSSLTGNSDITINIDENVFSSAGIQMNLRDNIADESLVIDATVSNPELVVLNRQNLFSSLYANAMVEISHFSLNRFMPVKHDNNEITASIYLSGTLEHPYATASVERLTFLLNDAIASASGSVILEERDLTINDFTLKAKRWQVSEVSGNVNLKDYTGTVNALFTVDAQKSINMPLVLTIEDSYVPQDAVFPESLNLKLACPSLSGTLIKKPVAFDISANYTKDFLSFYSSENLGLFGTYEKEEGLYATWNMSDMISAEITGSFGKTEPFVKIANANINLGRLFSNMTIDEFIKIDQGILKGTVTMRGPFNTPDFKGALSITSPVFYLPFLFEQKLSTDKMLLTATNNEFTLAEATYNIKNVPKFKMNSHAYMNKWSLDHFDMKLLTLENEMVPIKFKSPIIKLNSDADVDLLITWENKNIDFTGYVFAENLNIVSDLSDISSMNTMEERNLNVTVTTDLELKVGTHSSLNFNPLLRCVFVPQSSFKCKVDTASNVYQLDGSLQIKSGDVAYLNRNFYIKEGHIKFNPQDITNPFVTIKAETRERDSEGQTVRIILSAENQYLLDFNPRFSSIPAKPENEIQLLLGQIVLADSDSVGDFVISAGEYYLQSTVVRDLENKLRDLLNFDIFSVRTNILQNTINLSTQRNDTNRITVGNFFDNSTVYIGKYIGNALYVDAMLSMTASDYVDTEYLSTGNLLFQPEFGLELELPVLNIRWDMTWDINPGLKFKSYVPSTSLQFSWKFNF